MKTVNKKMIRAAVIASTVLLLGVAVTLNIGGLKDSLKACFQKDNTIMYYVSPSGSDRNPGNSAKKPFATVNRAQQAVRELVEKDLKVDVTVYLMAGEYWLDESIAFDMKDSGSEQFKVTYSHYQEDTPVLRLGKKVTGWQLVDGKSYYRSHVGKEEKFVYTSVFENGIGGVIARYPNEKAPGVKEYTRVSRMEAAGARSTFGFKPGDIPSIRDISHAEIDIWPGGVSGEWNWFENVLPVKHIDYAAGTVRLASDAQYELGANSRYFIQGALELLDAPGEFLYDEKAGDLFYFPRSEEKIDNLDIFVPAVGHVIKLKGESRSKPLQNIHFEGLLIDGSERDCRAFSMENVRNLSITNCRIRNINGDGIYGSGYIHSVTITGNLLEAIGWHGVRLENWNKTFDEPLNAFHVIRNNLIRKCGRIKGDGAAITLVGSHGSLVAHNRIYDMNRYAISMKSDKHRWIIDQKSEEGKRIDWKNFKDLSNDRNNIIEYNDISDVNNDSQDTGAIESWGGGPDNIIRYNRIHHTGIPFSFGYAIYLDDDCFGYTVEGNIIDHIQMTDGMEGKAEAAILAKGPGHRIINNLIADSRFTGGIIFPSKSNDGLEGEVNTEVYRNILYNSGKHILEVLAWDPKYRLKAWDRNMYFNPEGRYEILGMPEAVSLEEVENAFQRRYEQNSTVADPLFVNAEKQDYRLRYDSPTARIGFVETDQTRIGLEEGFVFEKDGKPADIRLRSEKTGGGAVINLAVGEKAKLELTARNETGVVIDIGNEVLYQSADAEVASVDPTSGVITAKRAGTTEIRATVKKGDSEKTVQMYVFVGDTLEKLEIVSSGTGIMTQGSKQIEVVGTTRLGQVINFTRQAVFTDEGSEIITVDPQTKGLLHAGGGEGTEKLIAAVSFGGKEYKAEEIFVVKKRFLGNIAFAMEKLTLHEGERLPLAITGKNTDDSAADLQGAVVEYSMDSSGIAEIVEGELLARAPGLARITAKVEQDGVAVTTRQDILIEPLTQEKIQGMTCMNFGEAHGYALQQDGKIHLASTGYDVWHDKDDFTYLYRQIELKPDQKLVMTLDVEQFSGSHKDASIGVMFRDSEVPDALHVHHRFTKDGNLRYVFRNEESLKDAEGEKKYWGSQTGVLLLWDRTVTLPARLKLVKEGSKVTGYYEAGGKWEEMGSVLCEFTNNGKILAGIGIFSRNEKPASAVVTNVVIERQ